MSNFALTQLHAPGEPLRGAARERMEALSSRVAVEQQNFLEEQWKRGTADRQRYTFVTQQAERQMQARRCRHPILPPGVTMVTQVHRVTHKLRCDV